MTQLQNNLFNLQTAHMQQNYERQLKSFDMQKRHTDENYQRQITNFDMQQGHLDDNHAAVMDHLTAQETHAQDVRTIQDEIIDIDKKYNESVLKVKALALAEDFKYWTKTLVNENLRVELNRQVSLSMATQALAMNGENGIIASMRILYDYAMKFMNLVNPSGALPPNPLTPLPPGGSPAATTTTTTKPKTITGGHGADPDPDVGALGMSTINIVLGNGDVLAKAVVPSMYFIDGVEKTLDNTQWRNGKGDRRI